MLKKILHTGLAVPDLNAALKFYKDLGFELEKRFHKSDINADVAMVVNEGTTFELLQFHDLDHPQVAFIKNHIAIYSDSLDEDISALLERGCKLVIPITEGVVFRFAYVQDQSGMNYEIATEKNQ